MSTYFFIAKNNIRKKKGDVAVIAILIAVAAMLLSSGLAVLLGTDNVFEQAKRTHNTADFVYVVGNDYTDMAMETLKEMEEVTAYEKSEVIDGNLEYRESLSAEKIKFDILIQVIDEKRTISKQTDLSENIGEWDVYLQYYLKSSFAEGSHFYLTIGDKEYDFIVKGYIEDPIMSTPMNISVYQIGITQSTMDKICAENDEAEFLKCSEIRTILKPGTDTQKFENTYVDAANKKGIPNTSSAFQINWNTMKTGGQVLSNVGMGIITVFAALLIAIVLVIVRFSVKNFLERSIKNLGILEAQGYTAKQLTKASILEMELISGIASIVGIIAGFFMGGFIGNLEVLLIGLQWNQPFSLPVSLAVFIFINAIIGLITYISNRKLRKLQVLDLLKGGINSHNFKKNVAALHRSRLPVNINLAWKSIWGEKRKAASMLIIMMIVAFVASVAIATDYGFVKDDRKLLEMVGNESCDVMVLSNRDLTEDAKEIRKWEQVSQVAIMNEMDLKFESDKDSVTADTDIWEDISLVKNDVILEGRAPVKENEVMISARIAETLDVKVGDIIYVSFMDDREAFVVSGIDQKINHLGRKAMMTIEAAQRINKNIVGNQLYITTKEGTSFDSMKEKLEKMDRNAAIINFEHALKQSFAGINSALSMICIFFIVLVVIIIIFIEMLLIQSRINVEKQNLGVNKALGYTSKQLMWQIALSNLPVVIVGAILGGVSGKLLGGSFIAVFFSFCGLKKVDIPLEISWIVGVVIAVSLIAVLSALFAARKIKRINPVDLLMAE